MTASDIIRRAMRLIGVLDANEAVEASESADALDTLNALFAEWRGSGIPVPDYGVELPGTELTLDLADREAVAYKLAMRISPEFGTSLSPEARESMNESWGRLQLRYFQPGKANFSELPGPSGRYDVITDRYIP